MDERTWQTIENELLLAHLEQRCGYLCEWCADGLPH